MIKRVLDEVKARGGDPAQVAIQLNLNITLAQRQNELEQVVSVLTQRKLQIIDDIDATAKQRDTIQAERDCLIDEVHDLKKERNQIEEYLAPAYWLLGVLGRHRELLRQHKDRIVRLLSSDSIEQSFSQDTERRIVELIADELGKHGALVPRIRLTTAQYVADSLKRSLAESVAPFLRNPKLLNLDQRRSLLGAFIEAGLNRDNFEAFRSEVEISWRKCPKHKTDLKIDRSATLRGILRWRCPEANCAYTE
jgi:hypothetical protein